MVSELTSVFGINIWVFLIIIFVIAIWSLIWKGFALWRAGRKNDLVWFIILLIINSLGILEILYLFWFSKMGKKSGKK